MSINVLLKGIFAEAQAYALMTSVLYLSKDKIWHNNTYIKNNYYCDRTTINLSISASDEDLQPLLLQPSFFCNRS